MRETHFVLLVLKKCLEKLNVYLFSCNLIGWNGLLKHKESAVLSDAVTADDSLYFVHRFVDKNKGG